MEACPLDCIEHILCYVSAPVDILHMTQLSRHWNMVLRDYAKRSKLTPRLISDRIESFFSQPSFHSLSFIPRNVAQEANHLFKLVDHFGIDSVLTDNYTASIFKEQYVEHFMRHKKHFLQLDNWSSCITSVIFHLYH